MALEVMSSRKRRPNWTDQECLFLAQMMEERKDVIRGKCSTGISVHSKRQAWEEITEAINAAFPQFQRTVSDCNKKWENLLAKSREEIKRQKMQLHEGEILSPGQLSDITQIVISVMSLSDRPVQGRRDPFIFPLMESQQSFDEDDGDTKPSTGDMSSMVLSENGLASCAASPTVHLDHFADTPDSPAAHRITTFSNVHNSLALRFNSPYATAASTPVLPFSTSCTTAASSAKRSTLQERMDLEMSVLRRQEAVLKLQEEYYSLKIKMIKKQNAGSNS